MIEGRTKRNILAAVGFLFILVVWQGIVWLLRPPEFLVPPPAKVVERALDLGVHWVPHLWATVFGTLAGFAIAAVAGFLLGVLIVHSRVASAIITPPLLLLQIVPKMALAPIILVWVGIGVGSRLTVVALVTFFPVVISTITGLQSTTPEIIDLARSLHMSRSQVLWKIRFPNALPHIFSGLRVASTLAVIGSIIAEFVGSQEGLGYVMLSAGFTLDTALQFAALALVTAFGVMFYGVIVLAERLSMPWYLEEVRLVEMVT